MEANELRDLEDGEIMRRGGRRRGGRKGKSAGTNGLQFPSPSRNSGFGGPGSAGGRDSALSSNVYGEKRKKRRRTASYEEQEMELGPDEDDGGVAHMMDRQVIAR